MIDMKKADELMHKKLEWQDTGDSVIPFSTRVEEGILEIRINNFPEENLYSLLSEGTPVIDFNEWPAQWVRLEIKDSSANRRSHGSFFSSAAKAEPNPDQIVDSIFKTYGERITSAVIKGIISVIVRRYPDEFSASIADLIRDRDHKPRSKL